MRLLTLLLLCAALGWPQARHEQEKDVRLPDGRRQAEEILKVEHRKSIEDADELMKTAEQLKMELEKNDRHVVSVASLKMLDSMEKLVKRIRSRLKR